MKTSVACCVYDGAGYLRAQLDSIVAQTVRPHELVIVDDGSRDGSAAVIEDFAREAAATMRVEVVRNTSNLGVVRNFEKAIAATTGDLVFLCDQDDVWHPEKVATMLLAFEQRPGLDLLFTNARLIDGAGTPLPHPLFVALELGASERGFVRAGHAFRALIARNLATGATTAFRRVVFEQARPFPIEWIHDEWLAMVAAFHDGRVDGLDECLMDYRQHGANQIGMRRLTLGDKLAKLFEPRGQRYVRLVRRTEVLVERLVALGDRVPADRLVSARDKLEHVRRRAALPRRRVARLLPVVREALTGRYALYSSGHRGILRDCTEP